MRDTDLDGRSIRNIHKFKTDWDKHVYRLFYYLTETISKFTVILYKRSDNPTFI